jgi:hypothetical protein
MSQKIARRSVIAGVATCFAVSMAYAQDPQQDGTEPRNDPSRLLLNSDSQSTIEAVVDDLQAELAFAESDAAGRVEEGTPKANSRCSTRPTISLRNMGVAFTRDQEGTRKFYVAVSKGKARIEFYHSVEEANRGVRPFASEVVSKGFRGKLNIGNVQRIYAVVTTLEASTTIYIHMEWFC